MTVKVPLIVFSGGVDSTYLLQQALREGNADVLYIHIPVHGLKYVKEKEAINNVIQYLEQSTGNKVVNRYEIDALSSFHVTNQNGHDLWLVDQVPSLQPPFWLFYAAFTVVPSKHSEVRIGYINGDVAIQFLPQIENFWKSLWALTRPPIDSVSEFPLVFPIRWKTKDWILRQMPEELAALTWSCQIPEVKEGIEYDTSGAPYADRAPADSIEVCGHCPSCMGLKAARLINKELYSSNDKEPKNEESKSQEIQSPPII